MGKPSAARGRPDLPERPAHYRELHTALIYTIIMQIRNLFEDHKRLLFIALLDAQLFKQTFPEAEIRSLDESCGAQFDLYRRADVTMLNYTLL